MPSNPYDAKGLLAAAIRDDNPVIFLEQKLLFFGEPAPVPRSGYAIELGTARVAREGTDVHRRRARRLVPHALRAARELEAEGIERRGRSTRARSSRSTPPRSRRRWRRRTALVVAHEAVQFGGFGAEIAAHVARALLLGSRRSRRPRRRAVAPDAVPEGPRGG